MKKIYTIFVCICLLAGFVACEKDKDFVLTTLMVQNETITPSYGSATIDCSFKADATISEAFVQYSLSSSFAKYDVAKMTEEKGKYAALLLGLQDNTTYYIRYAVSNKYSSAVTEEVMEFQTLQCTAPTIALDSIADVWDNRSKAYLHLTFDGGASVTDMGICWSKQTHPTIEDIHKSTKDTVAVLDMTDLQPNTTYYIRAYAVNRVGVSYSEEQEFTTYSLPEVRTEEVADIQENTALLSATLVFDGNDTATIKGFCWSDKAEPTIEANHIAIDTTSVHYTYLLPELLPATEYHVRAYAQNKIGVVYGEEKTFTTTKDVVSPTVTTAAITQITETGAVAGGNVTSDGGASVTERGVVYATTQNPTTADNKVAGGSGVGLFTCNLTNLEPNTTYYVRAYAVNSVGTAYGEEVTFMTDKKTVDGPTNGHEYVDLGLSSGTKWATMNIGAESPEEMGDYFAWGEVEPKSEYTWGNYKYCNGDFDTMTKYCTDSEYGIVDYKTQLELEDDAAHYNWGGDWRMPTAQEMGELVTQCTWEWTTVNGIFGYKVMGYNGNSIFLPVACYPNEEDPGISYYTSTVEYTNENSGDAIYLSFGDYPIEAEFRYTGCPIRPICKPEAINTPTVETPEVFNITENSADISIWVLYDGGSFIEERGVVYDTNYSPIIIEDDKQVTGKGRGGDNCHLINLSPNTYYHVRAYAINKMGVAYSQEVGFTTKKQVSPPNISTNPITDITETSAVAGGNVTSDGGASVTERGVVYATTQNPTTADNKVAGGSGVGTFTCNLTGLQPNTTYYVRAYAINETGTAYGEEVTFTTNKQIVLPSVITATVTQITETAAVAGGNVTSDGGASVTERGVVYATTQNPTTADNKVSNGSGMGTFTCNLTDLQPNTTYYVRAYATNSMGTAYGEEVSFTTEEEVIAIPEYVDLGLSVKWATMNVGASESEDYGDYFAWGEIEPKDYYDWSTYKWCNGSETTLTKYNTKSSNGTVDNKTQLELSDDAARANWGGSWRMPTDAEWTELREQCTWTWTTQNGVNGYKVTSKKSGYTNNSIFLPAAGYRLGSDLIGAGSRGNDWSSSLYTDSPSGAWDVLFYSDNVLKYGSNRYYGFSVRPVCQ